MAPLSYYWIISFIYLVMEEGTIYRERNTMICLNRTSGQDTS